MADWTKPLNDQDLIAVREQHLARLEALFAGQRLPMAFVLAGRGGIGNLSPTDDPEQWVAQALPALATQAERAADRGVFRPLCLEAWYCGVHFLDRILGARVFRATDAAPGDTGGWWADLLPGAVGTLRHPDLEREPTWALARRLATAMSNSGVAVPFLGTQVLSSPLNIALNLYGEAFLIALCEQPDAARHDLRVITDTICALHRWYRAAVPAAQFQPAVIGGRCQPRGLGQLCGCTTHLLSEARYREQVASFDAEVLAQYPRGGMIHLCGGHTQHLRTWREMPGLRAVQVNDRAADDLEAYFRGLREDQLIYWSPTRTMDVAAALKLTGGRRLVIAADLPEAPAL